MHLDLGPATDILGRTPRILDGLLRDLPEAWVRANQGGDTWSAFDVVGHLLLAEEVAWIPRVRVILEQGDAEPFAPFDRFAFFERSTGKRLADLLEGFADARARSLRELASLSLTPRHLERRGRHPELGAVTLGQLLATWVVHDLNHLGQIVTALAKQQGEAVGPWRALLGILA